MVLRSGAGDGGEPGADAADRRAVPGDAVLWQSADDGLAAASRRGDQSQAGAAADAADGIGGDLSEAADDSDSGMSQVSLLAAQRGNNAAEPRLERRHHL